eukprot:5291689-Pyramimonas_sp.AAC.1
MVPHLAFALAPWGRQSEEEELWKYWGAGKKGKQFKGLVCSGYGNKKNQLGAQWCYHCHAPLPQLAPARSPVAQCVWAPQRRGPPG